MIDLDDVDRRLISRLKIDGRASVTTLANVLGLARGTVQSRLRKLIETRTIKRFTVELNAIDTEDMVHANMMVKVKGNTADSVQKTLQRMDAVTSLYRTCGVWDLVLRLETTSLPEFDRALHQIREISGVSNSETCPLLRQIV